MQLYRLPSFNLPKLFIMTITTPGCKNIQNKWHYKPYITIKNFAAIILAILFLLPIKTFSQSGNIDQIRNGPASDPSKNFYSTFPNPTWVNGNAGASNAH